MSSRRALLLGPRVDSPEVLAGLLAEAGAPVEGLRAPSAASSPLVVGVDGGVAFWRALGVTPRVAVGDWDSLPGGVKDPALQGLHLRIDLSPDKERSDLHAAVLAALEQGATELDCFGVLGGRADHHLATLLDLAEASDLPQVARIEAWDALTRVLFAAPAHGETQVPAAPGALFSVFALGGPARLSVRGARYPLQSDWLQPSSRGLSNRVGEGIATLRVETGRVAVLVPRD